MNGLMRAVESLWQVVTDGSRIRYYSELLYGNAEWAFYTSITGGTAGFPVPELGGSFFVFGGVYVYFVNAMALILNSTDNFYK